MLESLEEMLSMSGFFSISQIFGTDVVKQKSTSSILTESELLN